ncbi:flagellin [Allopseudospirillum japonicum]|uniref:Flagellin n=1 Tax=Allopseudospirillum japonicum TaxID=64971 RepID=A0A1H6TJJ2_9GAMM|nr:hypothetical protein [Allopseudospirillum japonicum]SEI78354.1 flagellin [Allopseudospirillum japonicum]
MDSTINTNMPMPPALMQQGLNKIRPTSEVEVTFQRLSSGMRIRSAQEETQGFQVSTRLSPQVRDANSSIRNMNDAAGLAQTGLSGLKDVRNNLGDMYTLVKRTFGDATEAERVGYQEQFSKSLQAIDDIVNKTAFKGVKLLDGSLNAQINVNPQESFSFAISNMGTDTLGKQQGGTGGQALKEIDISTAEGAEKAFTAIANAMSSIDQATVGLGRLQNTSVSAQDTTFANTQGKQTPIRDTEFAPDPQITLRQQIIEQAQQAMSTQANQGRGTVMSLLS